MRIIEVERARGKLLGVIRVIKTFNREHMLSRKVLEGRVDGSGNAFIQLEELPKATRRVQFHSNDSVLAD